MRPQRNRKRPHSVQIVWEQVPVTVECQRRCLVPEKPLHDFDVRTAADRQRRARVPQIVQPHAAAANRRDGLRERVAHFSMARYSPRGGGNANSSPPRSSSSVASSRATHAGSGTVRAVWFFGAPSTSQVPVT